VGMGGGGPVGESEWEDAMAHWKEEWHTSKEPKRGVAPD